MSYRRFNAIVPNVANPGGINPVQGLYMPIDSALNKWQAAYALAAAGTTRPARLMVVHDSIGAVDGLGGGGNDSYAKSWPGVLHTMLNSRTGVDPGAGLHGTQFVSYGDSPITWAFANGGSSGGTSTGKDPSYFFGTGSTTTTLTFTSTGSGTLRLYLRHFSNGGTSTTTMDGTGTASINCNGSDGWFTQDFAFTGSGSHTFVITQGSANFHYGGAELIYPSVLSGVKVAQVGVGGQIGYNEFGSTVSGATPYNMLSTWAPDLALWCYGTNDVGQSVSSANYTTAVTNFINGVRNAGGDPLLLNTPSGFSGTGITQTQCYATHYALADTYGVAVLDFSRFPIITQDGTHPNPTGIQQYARAVYDAITARI